jgi:hypothetical protein
MSTRISSLIALVALAACSNGGKDAAMGTRIDCALDGAAEFARDCTVEAKSSHEGSYLVVHRPDGGFRRLGVGADGRTVSAADGAEEAAVTDKDGGLEVRLGADRYHLPLPLPSADAPDR